MIKAREFWIATCKLWELARPIAYVNKPEYADEDYNWEYIRVREVIESDPHINKSCMCGKYAVQITALESRIEKLREVLVKLSRNFKPMINDPCCERMKENLFELRVRKTWCDEALKSDDAMKGE